MQTVARPGKKEAAAQAEALLNLSTRSTLVILPFVHVGQMKNPLTCTAARRGWRRSLRRWCSSSRKPLPQLRVLQRRSPAGRCQVASSSAGTPAAPRAAAPAVSSASLRPQGKHGQVSCLVWLVRGERGTLRLERQTWISCRSLHETGLQARVDNTGMQPSAHHRWWGPRSGRQRCPHQSARS